MPAIRITRLVGFGQKAPEEFHQSPLKIGSGPGCEIRFDPFAARQVAQHHATLEARSDGWFLRDAGSNAGIRVNGNRIQDGIPLSGITEIELGQGGPRLRLEPMAEASQPAVGVSRMMGGLEPRPVEPVAASSAPNRFPSRAFIAVAAALIVGLIVWRLGGERDGSGKAVADLGGTKATGPAENNLHGDPDDSGEAPVSPPEDEGEAPPAHGPNPKPAGKKLLVHWKHAASANGAMARSFSTRYSYSAVRTFSAVGGGKVQVLQLPAGKSSAEVMTALRGQGEVEAVEEDQEVRLFAEPNDPALRFGLQWGVMNAPGRTSAEFSAAAAPARGTPAWKSGQPTPRAVRMPRNARATLAGGSNATRGLDCRAPEGWSRRQDASGILIGVIDTGVRYTHADLKDNMWTNPGEISGNGIDDDGNGVIDDIHGFNAVDGTGDPMDDAEIGHGTHCAGILGAVGDNRVGITGVAWKARILACKVFTPDGSGSLADVMAGMDYAARMGAKVLNCSLGGGGPESQVYRSFIGMLGDAGVVVVAAAGNESTDTDGTPAWPACFDLPNVISVGSFTADGSLSSFSNFGARSVDLFAPGSKILSTHNRDDDDYIYLDGTSMATPHVTGAVALLAAEFPRAKPAELVARLLSATTPHPGMQGKCVTGGYLDLGKLFAPSP